MSKINIAGYTFAMILVLMGFMTSCASDEETLLDLIKEKSKLSAELEQTTAVLKNVLTEQGQLLENQNRAISENLILRNEILSKNKLSDDLLITRAQRDLLERRFTDMALVLSTVMEPKLKTNSTTFLSNSEMSRNSTTSLRIVKSNLSKPKAIPGTVLVSETLGKEIRLRHGTASRGVMEPWIELRFLNGNTKVFLILATQEKFDQSYELYPELWIDGISAGLTPVLFPIIVEEENQGIGSVTQWLYELDSLALCQVLTLAVDEKAVLRTNQAKWQALPLGKNWVQNQREVIAATIELPTRP